MFTGLLRKCLAGGLAAVCAFGVIGCAPSQESSVDAGSSSTASSDALGEISVYSREDGSGTRGAFVELFGLEEKLPDGTKVDLTTDSAAITNSTSVMMTSVASDPNAIGYISLGSLNKTVKAVDIDGVAATPENVKSGDYQVSRPFNIVVGDSPSAEAQDFIDFIMSADGQDVVEENNYITVDSNAVAYTPSGITGKIVVAGSSSVTPVMEKLAEAYEAANPGATVEVQQSDSTTGVNMAIEKTCDIGMASRDLKDSESSAGVSAIEIARDGIAVIVSLDSQASALDKDQVRAIFAGDVTTWAEVLG